MTFFSGSPASGWTRNFRLDYIELPQVCFIIVTVNIGERNNVSQNIISFAIFVNIVKENLS